MKKIIATVFVIIFTITIYSQNQVDALRYSQFYFGGTARSMGMAGAFGSAGADFSTASSNPAGLGLYKSSEFTFSPSFYSANTLSKYNNKSADDQKFNFNVNNLGLVFNFDTKKVDEDRPGWNNVQFAFGVNRLNNFNNRAIIQGDSPNSSMLNLFASQANGNTSDNLDRFGNALAFDTWLIDTFPATSNYYSVVPKGGVLQRKLITTSGGINEMAISLSANYSEKLYIGGTVGFPYVRYSEQSQYYEIDNSDTIADFKSFTYSEDLTTTGNGFNFKFGLIYRINDFVRFGAAFHTPTFYSLKDSFSKTMKSSFDNGKHYSSNSPLGNFNYELTTPMKMIGNISFIVGKFGMLNAEYEFIDYSDARLRSSSYKYFDENQETSNLYTATSNIKFGGEVRLAPFSIRGGYAMYGSPYKANINDGKKSFATFGLGVRESGYFIDLAYIYALSKEDYYLYAGVPTTVNNKTTNHNVVLTVGVKY